MSRFLNPQLNALTPYTPGEQPRDMDKLIKLNTNENPFPPAPGVQRVINAEAAARLRLYNDPTAAALRAKMASVYGLTPSNVFFGNGSDEVLALSFLAFGADGVNYADITYGFYPVLADLFHLRANVVPLREDLSLALEDYEGARGVVVIANPNAPTGIALPRAELEKLIAADADRLVIVDEAYVDFGAESCVPLLEKYDNLLVVGTFSKSRSLAGARLGYALGCPALIADLERVKFSFHPYNVNSLTQAAGIAALEDKDYFLACRVEVAALRGYLCAELRRMGCTIPDSLANFLFVRANKLSGADFAAALRSRGILVRHFTQPRIEDYVRITVGVKDDMDRLIFACREILQ